MGLCSLVTDDLGIDVEQAELTHLLVKEAYALEREVIVQWSNDINRERFLHADMKTSKGFLPIKKLKMELFVGQKASRLGVRSSDQVPLMV